VADVRDASDSERPCRASSRDEKPHATVAMRIDRVTQWRACERLGDVPAAVRS
jgi:hypothetical protein